MPKVSNVPDKRQIFLLSLITLLVVAADQLTKIWIQTHLDVNESLPETGWLRLTHVQNTGAAFGLFQGQSFPLMIVGMVGVCVLLVCALFIYRRFPFLDNALGAVALSFILGGTIGNLIDRLRFGYVTDFIDLGFWPAFNIADSAIVVGTVMFAYLLFSTARADKRRIMRR